jgi:SAM-dependent methyltransferase
MSFVRNSEPARQRTGTRELTTTIADELRELVEAAPLTRPFTLNEGHAFTVAIPQEVRRLVAAGGVGVVLEDGKPLGPATVQHAHIRKHGAGSFCLWNEDLYFSSSDNTDCNENGRRYALAVIDFSKRGAAYQQAAGRMSQDDEELLGLISRNYGFNNSFFLNFFGYFNVVTAVLERNGIVFPEAAIELGTGSKPYTGLRFLLEGTQRFVANDVMPIQRDFGNNFIQHLRNLLGLIAPRLRKRLDGSIGAASVEGRVAVEGLEICDQKPFEGIDVVGEFDLIFSTSVLEHVMKPRAIVEKMASLLKPGGHAWHCIDLRDHRDFDDPLAFLRLTDDEYASVNTENRLRASDWFDLLAEVGFLVVECEFGTYKSAATREHQYGFRSPERPWIDEDMRASFQPPFNRKSLSDLSITAIRVLCRKPN